MWKKFKDINQKKIKEILVTMILIKQKNILEIRQEEEGDYDVINLNILIKKY